jgi:hypothetical protein
LLPNLTFEEWTFVVVFGTMMAVLIVLIALQK